MASRGVSTKQHRYLAKGKRPVLGDSNNIMMYDLYSDDLDEAPKAALDFINELNVNKDFKITNVDILQEFDDDHADCFMGEVTIVWPKSGTKKYIIEDWWTDPRTWYHAEAGKTTKLKNSIIERIRGE